MYLLYIFYTGPSGITSLLVERRAQNRVINDVRKLVDEKINVLYEDFNDGKITLLNIYKETLENKSEKMLNYK